MEHKMPVCPICNMPTYYTQNWRGVPICNSCAAELMPMRRRRPSKRKEALNAR